MEDEKFRALTLDTQTVQKEGFRFDQGNLKLLRQFHGSPIQVIFSSIVLREIAAHMEEAIRALRTTLKGVGKDIDRLLPQLRGMIGDDELGKIEPGDAARTRLSRFLSDVEAEEVGAAWANLIDIERRYFEPLPPFAGSNNKKHEFPDAIALSALEGWAKANGKSVVAVSEDKGWVAYDSEFIRVVPNIAAALGILQTDPEHRAHLFVAEQIKILPFKNLNDSALHFFILLKETLEEVEFDVELESAMAADADYPEIKLLGYTVGRDFTIVKIEEDEIVAQIVANIDAEVSVDVSFSVHDSVDNDDVPMGSANVVRQVEFEATSLLVTFGGDFSSDDWVLAEVEVSAISRIIDLGYVTPDWAGEIQEEP